MFQPLPLILSSILVLFQLLICSAEPEVELGTTLLAVTYKDGVVVGADTRTSVSGYVSNRFAYKIAPILGQAVICRSGSAADTQQLADKTKWELQARDYRYQIRPTLTQISSLLRSLMIERSGELSASLICAGYDREMGCGRIYSISTSGFLMEEEGFAVSGSGSTFILGHIDNAYIPDMSEEDAVDFVVQSVQLAMGRDGSSGGFVRVHVLNAAGQKTLTMYPKDSNQKAPESRALPGFAKPKILSKSK
jgi:20S proteasome subunit beta 1